MKSHFQGKGYLLGLTSPQDMVRSPPGTARPPPSHFIPRGNEKSLPGKGVPPGFDFPPRMWLHLPRTQPSHPLPQLSVDRGSPVLREHQSRCQGKGYLLGLTSPQDMVRSPPGTARPPPSQFTQRGNERSLPGKGVPAGFDFPPRMWLHLPPTPPSHPLC